MEIRVRILETGEVCTFKAAFKIARGLFLTACEQASIYVLAHNVTLEILD